MLKRSNRIKKYNEYKKSKPVQLELFSLSNIFEDKRDKYSGTVGIYDVIPKYYHGDVEKIRKNGKYLDILSREFIYRKQNITINITPARLLQNDGSSKDFYPSQREEIIEDVLRKFATDPKRNEFLDDRLAVRFTLYELWKELKSIKHTFSYEEIRESLEILSKTNIEIKSKDNKIAFSSNMFETLGRIDENEGNIDNRIEEYSKKIIYFVRFNSLVSESIKNKTWRIINYKQCMSYRKAVSRYLHKRISDMFRTGDLRIPYNIMLTTIMSGSGMKEYKRINDNMRQVVQCLDEMIAIGSVEKYEMEKIYSDKRNNKTIDVKFFIYVSKLFFGDMLLNNLVLKNKEEVKQIQDNSRKDSNNVQYSIGDNITPNDPLMSEISREIISLMESENLPMEEVAVKKILDCIVLTNRNDIILSTKACIEYIRKQQQIGKRYRTTAILTKAIKEKWNPSEKEENNLSIEDKEKIVNDKIEKFISEQTDNNNIKLIFKNILKNFGRSIFAGWLMYMKYVELKEDILVFSVENKFVKDTIIKDYLNGTKKEIDGKTTWLRKGIEQVCKDTSPNIKQVKIISVKKQSNNKT